MEAQRHVGHLNRCVLVFIVLISFINLHVIHRKGLPQYVHFTFEQAVVPNFIHLTFQGGFVGTRCNISVLYPKDESESSTPSEPKHLVYIYPEDANRKQTFELPETPPVKEMKLVFEESSDFFGRITVYDLQITGLLASGDSDNNDQE